MILAAAVDWLKKIIHIPTAARRGKRYLGTSQASLGEDIHQVITDIITDSIIYDIV